MQKDAGNISFRSGAHDAARANYMECLELLGANPLGCPHTEWRRAVLCRVRARGEDAMSREPNTYPLGPRSNFWEGFRWNRTLAANLTGDDTAEGRRGHLDYEADSHLIREEQNSYIDLLTDEEHALHATALANYAMAAIATLRKKGMHQSGQEPWSRCGTVCDFAHDATALSPCLYLKISSGDAGPRTVPLVVDAASGEDMTIGQVKAIIADTEGVPADQQLLYFGGLLLEERRTLRHYAIQVDTGVYSKRGRVAFLWTKLLHVVDVRDPDTTAVFLDECSDSSRLAQDAWLACVQFVEMFRHMPDCDKPLALVKKVWLRKMELERGALGMLYDSVEGKVVVAPQSLPGTFRRFAEWCDTVGWGVMGTNRDVNVPGA